CNRGSAACSGGLIRVLFPAAESQRIFRSPAWQRALVSARRRRVSARQGTLVPAAPGCEICGLTIHPQFRSAGAIIRWRSLSFGGAQVCAGALPRCSGLFLARVEMVVDGGTFFSPFEHLFGMGEVILVRPGFKVVHYRRPSGD
ncbi:MAG: hypothetical protein ACP5MD_04800, partial [Verrucomicrobiia bacterium]